MYKSVVIVEDKDGNEHKGFAETQWQIKEDDLVTIKMYNGRYLSGFVVEIIGEGNESGNATQSR